MRRRHRLTVPERITADGTTLTALDEEAVEGAAVQLRDAGVEAIAIGFLFSFLDPANEGRAKEICERVAPDLFVCTSSEVIPEFREYERFSTTALNAYVAPSVRDYVTTLPTGSSSRAFGRAPADELGGRRAVGRGRAELPVSLLMSGPVAGVSAASGRAGSTAWTA